MKTTFFLLIVLFSTSLFAGEANCTGEFKGHRILLNFWAPTFLSLSKGAGRLEVNGREVARYEGHGLTQNMLKATFRATNDQGDLIEGKVVSLSKGILQVNRLKVPAYGIDFGIFILPCKHSF